MLTVLDIDLLALYAQSYSLIVEALEKIKAEGKFNTLYNDEGQVIGFVENPYMKVYRDNFIGCRNSPRTSVSRPRLAGVSSRWQIKERIKTISQTLNEETASG